MGSFVIVVGIMLVAMYLLIVRPQRAQQRKHVQLLDSIKVGDEIITVGGIYGDIVGVEPDRVILEIAEDVEIEVARRAVASVVPEEDAEGEADELEPVPEAERVESEGEPEPEPEEARR